MFPVPTPWRACLRIGAICLALTALSRQADAQIYSWVDSSGSLVISNVPQGANLGIAAAEAPADAPTGTAQPRTVRLADSPRSRSFDDLIDEHASRQGVRKDLVKAVIQVESGFNPRAVSNKGAVGLMQLMPGTARQLGVSNPFDPSENVRGGVAYLRQLLDRYDGDERLALAAYNAGPGAVDSHGQTVPPYRETRDYVSKVKGIAGANTGVSTASGGRTHIYRVVDIVDGQEVVTYTDRAPSSR